MSELRHDADAWRRSPEHILLLRYSEWLDADQGLIGGGDDRTHADLVSEFWRAFPSLGSIKA